MVTPDDIGWAQYRSWEGAYFRGTRRFRLPPKPTEGQMFMAVFTAVESGKADAVNGYDRAILSTGYAQLAEAKYFLTSNLLGVMAEQDPALLDPLQPALDASGAVFKRTPRGRWRFHFKDVRGEVDAGTEQKQLFLLNSSGHQGDWDDESVDHAKLWAASMANVLNQDGADVVQMDHVAALMKRFATNSARKILFDGQPSMGWTGAMRAIYLSFAGNLPSVASKQLDIAVRATDKAKWSPDWCITIAQQLTFGPKIAIYPHRYDAIRPVIEKLYGVDIPDFADELADWSDEMDDGLERNGIDPAFHDPGEIQQVLIDMGYDLGPCGADGVMGPKTKDAIMTFQGLQGLVPDGVVGPRTRAKLLETWRATS